MNSPVTSRLKASFEHDMVQRHEVSDLDIHFSRLSGISPVDIDVLCDFTREEALLLIIRCPKRPARYFHGRYDPKPMHVKTKSDPDTGLVMVDKDMFVSDYDLMSVWRFVGQGQYEKVVVQSVDDKNPMCFSSEANMLMDKLNGRLVSQTRADRVFERDGRQISQVHAKRTFQHGAQDDFDSPDNPDIILTSKGGKRVDRFMVFNVGTPSYVCNGNELKILYERLFGRDIWPYDANGIYHYSGQGHS
jgi:hypothetical protein